MPKLLVDILTVSVTKVSSFVIALMSVMMISSFYEGEGLRYWAYVVSWTTAVCTVFRFETGQNFANILYQKFVGDDRTNRAICFRSGIKPAFCAVVIILFLLVCVLIGKVIDLGVFILVLSALISLLVAYLIGRVVKFGRDKSTLKYCSSLRNLCKGGVVTFATTLYLRF